MSSFGNNIDLFCSWWDTVRIPVAHSPQSKRGLCPRSLWWHSAWRICSLGPQIWRSRRQLASQPTHEGTVGHVTFQRQQVGQAFVESLCFSSHTTWGWRYKWGEDQCRQVYIATRFTRVYKKCYHHRLISNMPRLSWWASPSVVTQAVQTK